MQWISSDRTVSLSDRPGICRQSQEAWSGLSGEGPLPTTTTTTDAQRGHVQQKRTGWLRAARGSSAAAHEHGQPLPPHVLACHPVCVCFPRLSDRCTNNTSIQTQYKPRLHSCHRRSTWSSNRSATPTLFQVLWIHGMSLRCDMWQRCHFAQRKSPPTPLARHVSTSAAAILVADPGQRRPKPFSQPLIRVICLSSALH